MLLLGYASANPTYNFNLDNALGVLARNLPMIRGLHSAFRHRFLAPICHRFGTDLYHRSSIICSRCLHPSGCHGVGREGDEFRDAELFLEAEQCAHWW